MINELTAANQRFNKMLGTAYEQGVISPRNEASMNSFRHAFLEPEFDAEEDAKLQDADAYVKDDN